VDKEEAIGELTRMTKEKKLLKIKKIKTSLKKKLMTL